MFAFSKRVELCIDFPAVSIDADLYRMLRCSMIVLCVTVLMSFVIMGNFMLVLVGAMLLMAVSGIIVFVCLFVCLFVCVLVFVLM